MVPLNWPLQAPPPQDMRWLLVEDASAVSACRNAVLAMAGRLQFPAARADQLALAVTEAASVTARASWSARAAGNCSRSAMVAAAWRQPATALASSTRSHRRSAGSGALNGTT